MNRDDDKTRTHVVLTKGTMVSHYRIVEKIGAGGMGEVYLAEDTKLKRRVALKFMPAQFGTNAHFKARFIREAEAMAKLNHPNIITIHEVSEYQGSPFFAMELVEGQSLRDLAKGKELSVDRIIELAIQICDGLGAAHDKQVVHRDIKPSNIVIDAYGRPKILDFGLAAIQGGEHLTKTGSTLGTVRYMSPEQVQGHEVDHRSDLFSFGVVLYELISGRTPFERDNDAATLKAITEGNPEPLARYKTDIPHELQRTVSKLLEKDVSLRYQHADGVISDLRRLLTPTHSSISVTTVSKKSRLPLTVGGLLSIAVLFALGINYWLTDDSVPSDSSKPKRKMLAVLPFENLGAPEDEYFADGITDEITSRLASVSGLGVISRTSAMQYKDSKKSLPEIASELGVDYILEGTIRWDKSGDTDRVRITPQLIDVADNTHLWANNYERAMTQIFAVQEEIAIRISEALDLTLNEAERKAITSVPTRNMKAYDYYLKGLEYFNRREPFAEEMFEKAIELDSTFAPAYARLSYLHSIMYWIANDRTKERIRQIKSNADRALELDPDYFDAHMALGFYYYYVGRHYEKAIEEFEKGLALKPNEPQLLSAVAYIKRRQGKWEEAYSLQKQSLLLDPLSATISISFVATCNYMRLYGEGIKEAQRAISLHPDFSDIYAEWATIVYAHTGDARKSLEIMDEAQEKTDMMRSNWVLVMLTIADRDYDKALETQNEMLDEARIYSDTCGYYYGMGDLYYLKGEFSKSKIYFDSALSCWQAVYTTVVTADDSAWINIFMAETFAGLGLTDKAIELGEKAYGQIPIERDAIDGMTLMDKLANIYIRVGEYDRAIDLLEVMLSKPSQLSVSVLKSHPYGDTLRDHPRFKALMEKYDTGS